MSRHDDEEAISELLEELRAAIRAADAERCVARYADDVVAFDLIGPLTYHGRAAVRERAAAWLASFDGPISYDLKDVTIAVGGDVGFCHSLNHVRATTKNGVDVDMWWRSTLCVKRVAGRWWVTHAHSSVPFDTGTHQASLGLRP